MCLLLLVPTSIGYGVSDNGKTALFAMLQSCAPGIAVVNIDNGFGAGVLALTIVKIVKFNNFFVVLKNDFWKFNPEIHDYHKLASLTYDVDFRTYEKVFKNKDIALFALEDEMLLNFKKVVMKIILLCYFRWLS